MDRVGLNPPESCLATILSPSPVDVAPAAALARRVAWGVMTAALFAAAALLAAAAIRPSPPPVAMQARVAVPAAAKSAVSVGVIGPLPVTPTPTTGSTGTTALPTLPLGAAFVPASGASVAAAAPFRFGGASGADRGRALQCLTAAIYYEAASEPDAGQQAVAQVVLNRARHPAFPGTVCGVVYQGSEGRGCQFSFACDGAITRNLPSPAGWARAARVAALALAGRVYAPVGLATHYHTFAVTPAWNRSLVMTDAVGAHLFHRWEGWWGTAAAFSRPYRGGEPDAGPHPSPAAASVPPAVPVASKPLTPLATIQPAYRASGSALAAPTDDALPPASAVLPRWRDAGRPLR